MLTAAAILERGVERAASRDRFEVHAYVVREFRALGIHWEQLPETTKSDVIAQLERATSSTEAVHVKA